VKAVHEWAAEFDAALRDYLGGSGELALHRAYELGRKALGERLSVLDLVAAHSELLAELLTGGVTPDSEGLVARATEFFVESLSPYEMTHRGFRESNAQLMRWKHVFEHAGWGVVISSRSGERLEMMNPAFARMHGYTIDELTGRPIAEVSAPEMRTELRDHVQLIHERGHHTFESVHVRKDKSRFPVLVDATAVKSETGEVLYRAFNVQDITERKRNEESLRRATAAAEEANRELEAFSYSVAHDLQAPLRSINGFSQALLEDYPERLDEQGRTYLRHVSESAQQMARLIDDLLELSRVTRSELQRNRVNLSVLAREVIARLQRGEAERRVEAIVHDGLVAEGDARLFAVILENLLGNAWKFTNKRPLARIEFGARPDDRPVTYFVRDNGAGFDMAYANKLFGVFQRLHSAREFEGTGIGLATVQRIVFRHGGRVWAEGEVDKGATFYFTLGG
jgi:PAS domain S-box-containing protein